MPIRRASIDADTVSSSRVLLQEVRILDFLSRHYERTAHLSFPASVEDWYTLTALPSIDKNMNSPASRVRIQFNAATSTLVVQCKPSAPHDVVASYFGGYFKHHPDLATIQDTLVSIMNSTFNEFVGSWEHSSKEPDAAVKLRGNVWPWLVAEVGWNESYDDLINDAKLWLLGGRSEMENDCVRMVLLAVMSEVNSVSATGSLELWERSPEKDFEIRRAFYPRDPTNPTTLDIPARVYFGSDADRVPVQIRLDSLVDDVDDALKRLIRTRERAREKKAGG